MVGCSAKEGAHDRHLNKLTFMDRTMKTPAIIETLRARHRAELFFTEVRGGAGYGGVSERRIDAWAMHPHPSRNNCRVAYEIKVSRRDFLRELKDPKKRKAALLFSNEYYFAAPKGLIKPGELPAEAGLIEVIDTPRTAIVVTNDDCVIKDNPPHIWNVVVRAPWRDTPPPSWRFVVSLLRNSAKNGT